MFFFCRKLSKVFGMALFVSAFLFPPISGKDVTIISYGEDQVFLQNDYTDSRWLTGGHRKSGNTKGSTPRVLKGNSKVDTFIWTVRSNYQITDPKRGQCLKYRDTIYLQVRKSQNKRWLTARARDKGNAAVRTRNVLLDELKVVNTYQWAVRSNTGTGMLDRA